MAVVKINAITVPAASGEELEKRFSARASAMDKTPGFKGFQLLRPVKGEDRYFVVTEWDDDASFEAWRVGGAAAAHAGATGAAPQGGPVSTGADLLEFEVVIDARPPRG